MDVDGKKIFGQSITFLQADFFFVHNKLTEIFKTLFVLWTEFVPMNKIFKI